MKVALKNFLSNEFYHSKGPKPGDVGEALYFRYNENNALKLFVLFYGYPGIHEVWPEDVSSLT